MLYDNLHSWLQCCIFTAGALLLPALTCLRTRANPPVTICAPCTGLTTSVAELCVFFSRAHFEITSTSRNRSTVISMVMLVAVPIYQIIWFMLQGSYRGSCGVFRLFRWWR